MNTDDDVVTLSDANFNVIDNFKYTAKNAFPFISRTKGVSLERIDFNRATDDRTNWNSAAEAVGFATRQLIAILSICKLMVVVE
jgi:hypothetical protein